MRTLRAADSQRVGRYLIFYEIRKTRIANAVALRQPSGRPLQPGVVRNADRHAQSIEKRAKFAGLNLAECEAPANKSLHPTAAALRFFRDVASHQRPPRVSRSLATCNSALLVLEGPTRSGSNVAVRGTR